MVYMYGTLIHKQHVTGPALIFIQRTNACFSSVLSDFNGDWLLLWLVSLSNLEDQVLDVNIKELATYIVPLILSHICG